jgi:nitrogen fixation protein NifQ
MTPTDVYRWLMASVSPGGCDAFDAHVVASILAISLVEAKTNGTAVTDAVGLSGADLAALTAGLFPAAAANFARIADESLAASDEHTILRDLLIARRSGASDLEVGLAAMVAARALRPDHLWQDLGLRNRRELSWLMQRHFEPIAMRNTGDMKWKKYLYRELCAAEGFSLCTAPSCAECCDFDTCFGAEDGESRLADLRRTSERAASGLAVAAE